VIEEADMRFVVFVRNSTEQTWPKVVESESSEAARSIYIQQVLIKDPSFLADVYDPAGFLIEHIFPLNNHDTQPDLVTDFAQRVRAFFRPHDDYAEIYLGRYGNPSNPPDAWKVTTPFPDAMLEYVAANFDFFGELVVMPILEEEILR
jgi:hypothetical protein